MLATIWGSGLFFCFDIKTWGYRGTSNWWLLRERGFLRSFREQAGHTGYFTPVGSSKSHLAPLQGISPLCAPQKAIYHQITVVCCRALLKKPSNPLTLDLSSVKSQKDIYPLSLGFFFQCVILKKPFNPLTPYPQVTPLKAK